MLLRVFEAAEREEALEALHEIRLELRQVPGKTINATKPSKNLRNSYLLLCFSRRGFRSRLRDFTLRPGLCSGRISCCTWRPRPSHRSFSTVFVLCLGDYAAAGLIVIFRSELDVARDLVEPLELLEPGDVINLPDVL